MGGFPTYYIVRKRDFILLSFEVYWFYERYLYGIFGFEVDASDFRCNVMVKKEMFFVEILFLS